MMVLPFLLRFTIKSKMILLPKGSKPAVGSSKINTSGSIAIIPAIATLRFSPPDNSKGERL